MAVGQSVSQSVAVISSKSSLSYLQQSDCPPSVVPQSHSPKLQRESVSLSVSHRPPLSPSLCPPSLSAPSPFVSSRALTELYRSIKLAITPPSLRPSMIHPSIHPLIQSPKARRVVGTSPGWLLPLPPSLPPPLPPVSCPLSWTLFFLFFCRRRRSASHPPTALPPRSVPGRGGFLLTGGKQSGDGVASGRTKGWKLLLRRIDSAG